MNKLHIFFHNFIACFLIVGVILSSFGFRASSVSAQSYEFSECDDGVDNDGDSFVDYPRDSDCFDFYGSEQAPTPAPAQTVPTRANDISSNTKTYRIPGTYDVSVPAGMNKAVIKTWGAGGGGGSGTKTSNHHVSGFGGGGGGYAEATLAVVPGNTLTVVVGSGGMFGEGGSNSEVSVSGTVIAGAGGGGGGLSVGGPGYKDRSGLFAKIAIAIVAVVAIVVSAGALASVAPALSSTVGIAGGGTVAGVQGVGATLLTASGAYAMPAYTVTATALSTSATVLGPSLGVALTTGITSGTISAITAAGTLAQQMSRQDPRRPGGVDGLDGYGFGGVRGGLGAGLGGKWVQSAPSQGGDFGGSLPTEQTRVPLPLKIIGFITQAKQVLAQAFQPVSGTGGSGYAGASISSGGTGGPYGFVGGNPYASSGGAGANGGAGGERGRTGRDGGGHCGSFCTPAKDGTFPGGGGGGSDTGVGGFGGDGQVVIEFTPISGPVSQCRDGVDNNGDGLVDYPADPCCTDVNDPEEGYCSISNTAPVASLTCPASLRTGEVGSFVGRGTDADAGDTLSYTFNWGGGATDTVSGNSSGTDVTRTKSWPTTGTYTVQFSVTDSAGLSSATNASCVVTVTTGTPLPLVTIDAQPRTVPTGGATVLAWSATDAQSCNAYSVPATAWTGAKATSGNNFPVVINQQTSFWLSCTGPGGVGTNYVTVFVSPSCPVGTLWNPATSRCENLVPVNSPTASITGDTTLTVGQTGTWNYSVADADGNLSRWRFRAGTNRGAGWTTISGSSRSGTYSQSFASPGTYTWVVDVEDAGGRTGTDSINVIVTATGGDLCPNIAGTQSSVPTGMIVDTSGNCVTAPIGGDLCPNIAGTQSSVPVGMTIDASGNCVASGGTITQCSDSIDNDGDGNIDYPADSGCTGPTDDDENLAPTASITGSTALTVGQTGTWNYSVADADGNLSRWRFRAGTNPGAGWTTISGSSRSGTYSQSFASPGTYTWVVDVEDAKGAVGNATLSVTVTPVGVIPPTCPASYPDVTVTGVTGSGSVWGSGPYTDDSVVSRAAVHQGLISSGQTATIKRTSAGYVSSYVGSTRNGVTTSSYGAYCGMTLSLATVPPVIPTDLCPNIAGTQSSVPVGMTIDASGNCVASGPSLTPTLDLTADNYSVFFGLGTTLRWSSTNVTSCTASGNWSGSKSTSGSESTGGLWSDKTYTLMCTGPNGSVSKTIVINVGLAEACRDGNDNDGDGFIDYPADPGCTSPTDTDETDTPSAGNLPPVVNLSASPTLVYSGTGVYLVWNSTNATACTASSNPNVWSGTKALSSTENVYGLTQQTTFTLTCTGPGGSGSDSVTIYINPNPTPQCLDGLDNDGDSLIDWGTDPGCDSALDDDETDGGSGTGGGTTGGGGGGGSGGGGGGGSGGGGPVSTGMTLGGDTFVPVQFLGAMGSESGTAQLSVNPVGSFSSDVSVRVVSIVSRTTGLPVPVGTQVTYSFAGGAFAVSPVELMRLNASGQYINTSGSVGLPVKVKFSQQISEAYIVRFEASGGGVTDTHDLVVDPSGVSPDFREI